MARIKRVKTEQLGYVLEHPTFRRLWAKLEQDAKAHEQALTRLCVRANPALSLDSAALSSQVSRGMRAWIKAQKKALGLTSRFCSARV